MNEVLPTIPNKNILNKLIAQMWKHCNTYIQVRVLDVWFKTEAKYNIEPSSALLCLTFVQTETWILKSKYCLFLDWRKQPCSSSSSPFLKLYFLPQLFFVLHTDTLHHFRFCFITATYYYDNHFIKK